MSRLPVDVEIEILVRLPAKSLLRFKSVCKLWRELINESVFRNRHLEQSNKHIIFRSCDDDVHMCDFDTLENPRNLNFPFRHRRYAGLCLVGLCRGLLCISIRRCTIFLYNPTTRTFKALPSLESSSTPISQCLLFGYDPLSQDYKCASIELSGKVGRRSPAMVYSLRHDAWKPLATDWQNYSDSFKDIFRYSVSVSGVVHWGIEFEHLNGNIISAHILGFDLTNEALTFVPLPVNVTLTQNVFIHPGMVDSCLCLIYSYFHHYDVWIMKEYGVATSWTSLCKVWHPPGMNELRPISFFKNTKELLLVESSNGTLAALDLKTQEIITTIAHPPGFRKLTGSFICLENLLVLPDGQYGPGRKYQPRNRNKIFKTYHWN